jgi:hypothetical protein
MTVMQYMRMKDRSVELVSGLAAQLQEIIWGTVTTYDIDLLFFKRVPKV